MFFQILNFCRWTSVQVPHTGVRSRLHPAVQPTATPPKPRVSDWAVEEPTVPLQHLWKGVCHRKQSEDPHGQGEQRGWWEGWRGVGASQNCPKCRVVPSLKFNLNDNQTFVCFHVCFICCWTWKIWPEQRIPIIDKTFRVSAKTGPSLQTNLYTGIT